MLLSVISAYILYRECNGTVCTCANCGYQALLSFSGNDRGVDKFVRVGGLGCCCEYMQIFSPQNTMYSNIIR